jgi:pimeloyl-ACP methyl ester carboxylesterase
MSATETTAEDGAVRPDGSVSRPGEGLWISERKAEDGGPGPLVVLVHGAMDRSSGMARVQSHLRDLHVLRYDRRGYGRSWQAGAPSLSGHAQDLVAVMAERPGVVVGHSYGGAVALLASTLRPDLIRAVGAYEAPLPSADGQAFGAIMKDMEGEQVAEWFLRAALGDKAWESYAPGIQEARRREGPAFLAEGVGLRTPPIVFDPADVTVPVVVGTGSRSHERYAGFATRLVRVTGAELVVVEGAEHSAHLSHPVEFAHLVRRVVARVGEWPPA